MDYVELMPAALDFEEGRMTTVVSHERGCR